MKKIIGQLSIVFLAYSSQAASHNEERADNPIAIHKQESSKEEVNPGAAFIYYTLPNGRIEKIEPLKKEESTSLKSSAMSLLSGPLSLRLNAGKVIFKAGVTGIKDLRINASEIELNGLVNVSQLHIEADNLDVTQACIQAQSGIIIADTFTNKEGELDQDDIIAIFSDNNLAEDKTPTSAVPNPISAPPPQKLSFTKAVNRQLQKTHLTENPIEVGFEETLLYTRQGKAFIEHPLREGVFAPAAVVGMLERNIEKVLARSHNIKTLELYAHWGHQLREGNTLNVWKIPQQLLLEVLSREKNISIIFWKEKNGYLKHKESWLMEDDEARIRHVKLDSQDQIVSLLQQRAREIAAPRLTDKEIEDIL